MSRAQQGDEQAYNRLLNELSDTIAGYLYSRFGNLEIVEDCVQECLIAIHCARHTYDPARPFRPWLFALVRNRAIDMLRSQKSYRAMIRRNDHETITSAPSEERLTQGTIFAALNPQHREALTLTKIIGLSIAETAARLGISESAVKVRVHRAIRASRKILEAECG